VRLGPSAAPKERPLPARLYAQSVAFFRAAREGDFEALLAVLDPDVVVRADFGASSGASREVRGAPAVAEQTLAFAKFPALGRPALVNGAYGIVAADGGRRYSVVGFIVRDGRIAEIDIFADPARLRQLDLAGLDG
jgi:RNA polymerase sigma-70 factor (ECF subfamily)